MRTEPRGDDFDGAHQQPPAVAPARQDQAATPPSAAAGEPSAPPRPQSRASAPTHAKRVPPPEQPGKQFLTVWDWLIGRHWQERHPGQRLDQHATCLIGSSNRHPPSCDPRRAWSGFTPGAGAGS
jgi:hypothetical protein